MKYTNGETYKGQWNLNARHGKGIWKKKNGELVEVNIKINNNKRALFKIIFQVEYVKLHILLETLMKELLIKQD